MKTCLLVLLALVAPIAMAGEPAGGEVIRIGKFSDRYRAEVVKPAGSETAEIRIYAGKNPRPVLKQASELGEYDLQQRDAAGEMSANIVERPYGDQSVLIHEDFDFDGLPDLALKDGNNSCYGGPSYQVYLANADGGFDHSTGFTALAQDNCGMFGVDAKKRRISTMTKSGCCWHQYDTYVVRRREPVLIESVEDAYLTFAPGIFSVTRSQYDPGTAGNGQARPARSETRYMRVADADQPLGTDRLLSFVLADGKRRVSLVDNGEMVDYLLTRIDPAAGDSLGNEEVEFSYLLSAMGYLSAKRTPAEAAIQPAALVMTCAGTGNSVSFSNRGVRYTVHDAPGKFGVEVNFGDGRTRFLAGDARSRRGDIQTVCRRLDALRKATP